MNQSISEIAGYIGEKSSMVTEKSISFLSDFGINISSTKLLNLLIILILLFLSIKVLNIASKPLKWVIIILLGILGISTFISII